VLFVTHDLSLGHYISDRTVILRHGRIVEMGDTGRVFEGPRHPYTRMLLASVPKLDEKWAGRVRVSREGAEGPAPGSDNGWEGDGAALVEVEPGHLVALPEEPRSQT
jgi:peptide/nickel transport system ATP-binding protein